MGLEQRTLVERSIEILRLPFSLGCILVAAVFTLPILEYVFPGASDKTITVIFNPELGWSS